jgi:methionine-rich copper-binding protein CopC
MKHIHGILLASALLTGSILAAHKAEAHAHLVSAEPVANQMAMTSPTVLKLKFSEELNVKLSSVTVLGPDKKPIEQASIALDPKDAKVLIVTFKAALPEGKDTVNWVAVATDGHKTTGSYTLDAMN